MADDVLNGLKPMSIPSIDLSYTTKLASSVQAQMEESIRQTQKIGQEAYNNREKMQEAMEQTAINTAEAYIQLHKVVYHQNEYIDLLKNN